MVKDAEAMLAEAVGDCMRLAVVRETQENSTHDISMVFIPILCRCLMIVAHMPRIYAVKSVGLMAKSMRVSQRDAIVIICQCLIAVAQMSLRHCCFQSLKPRSQHESLCG
jgi:hypothetical protein